MCCEVRCLWLVSGMLSKQNRGVLLEGRRKRMKTKLSREGVRKDLEPQEDAGKQGLLKHVSTWTVLLSYHTHQHRLLTDCSNDCELQP